MKKISFLIILFLLGGSLLSFGEDKGAQIPPLSLPTIPEKVTPAQPIPIQLPSLSLPAIPKKGIPAQPIPVQLPSLSLSYPQKEPLSLNLFDFSGGLNLKAFPTELKDNEVQVLNNAWWRKGGALGRRQGWLHYPIPDSNASINGLFRFYKQDGTRYLLVGGDTALYRAKNDSTSFVKIKGAIPTGYQFYFSNYKNNLYITYKNTIPFYYTGTGIVELGLADSNSNSAHHSCVLTVCDDCDSCAMTITDKTKSWVSNQWSGYICRIVNETDDDTLWGYIFSNTPNRFCIHNLASIEGTYPWLGSESYSYTIYSWYQLLTPLYRGDVDSIYRTICGVKIWERDTTFRANIFRENIAIRILNGEEASNFSFLAGDSGDSLLFIAHPYTNFDDIAKGDSFILYRMSFWTNNYVTIFKNRLILASDSVSDNIIYYSIISNPNAFAPLNLFSTYTPDGDFITGIMTLYNDQMGQRASPEDRLLIFKQNNILATDDNFAPYIISTGVGAVAPRSIVNVEGLFVGFAHTSGYYGTDGNKVSSPALSEPIKPFWDNINKTAIDKIACGYYDRHIVCSVPYGSSTENDTGLIYNIDNHSWSTASLKASVFANQWGLQDTVKFIWGRPDTGWVCKYGLSNLDNGTDSIVLSYRSKEFDFGSLNSTKKFQEIYVTYDKTLPLTFNFYKDFGNSAVYSTFLTGTGKNIIRVPLSNDIQGKTISWGISSKDPSITIGGVQIRLITFGGL